jgi:hypothetical protein
MTATKRETRDTDPAPPDTVRADAELEELSPDELAQLQTNFRDALAQMVAVVPQLFANLETAPLAWHELIGALRALGATDAELERVVNETDANVSSVIEAETTD